MVRQLIKPINLSNFKKIGKNQRKKVLLINCKRAYYTGLAPHLGLAILAAILKKRGHEVLVVDYLLNYESTPKIEYFLNNFKPDVIGLTTYIFNMHEVDEYIEKIRNFSSKMPIIIGGPHVTLFPEEFKDNKQIDYLALREAETLIIPLVEKAKREKTPKFIETDKFVDLNELPFPDFQSFYKWETILCYPIETSRGCPHQCSFCSVSTIYKRRWRAKTPKKCVEELARAKKIFPNKLNIFVVDDSPLINKQRFADFLKLYHKNKLGMKIALYNSRADNITEEILFLLKKTGCTGFTIGVEHTDPEVCQLINKGESPKDIVRAVKLLKKYKYKVTLFMVLGLPKDNVQKVRRTALFMRKLKADEVCWNIYQYRGPNRAADWFDKYGKIDRDVKKPDLRKKHYQPEEPVAEQPGFEKEDIKRAFYMASFITVYSYFKPKDAIELYKIARKYNLEKEFFYWLPRGFLKYVEIKYQLVNSGFNFLRKNGVTSTLKRLIYFKKLKRI